MIILDAAIPTIFIEAPLMIMALIPVIIVEGYLLIKFLHTRTDIFKTIILANIVSTFLGIPIAWGIRLLLGLGIDYLGGNDNLFLYSIMIGRNPGSNWKAFIIIALIVITTYWVSVLSEYWVAKRMLVQIDRLRIWKGILFVNLVSYVMIIGIIVILAIANFI